MRWIKKNPLYVAWVIVLAGVLLSLYVSEIMQMEPCDLCWYQRLALFPLAIILGMANYKKDLSVIPYALPLVWIGGVIAVYQALVQFAPATLSGATCGRGDDCTTPVFTFLGFITFPVLSAMGFLAIGVLLVRAAKRGKI